MSIPEIVDDRTTGILIEPRSPESLYNAIVNIDSKNYSRYSDAAWLKFESFDSDRINCDLLEKIKLMV